MAQCAWPLNKYLNLPLSCLLSGNEDFPVHIWSCSPTLKHQCHALPEHLQGSNWGLYLTHLLSFICLMHMDKYEDIWLHTWKVHSHNKTSRLCMHRQVICVIFSKTGEKCRNESYWRVDYGTMQSLNGYLRAISRHKLARVVDTVLLWCSHHMNLSVWRQHGLPSCIWTLFWITQNIVLM